MSRFHNRSLGQHQGISYPARWMAVRLGGDGVANASGFYAARCPAHADERPSLSLRDTPHGLYFKCYGGCASVDVRAAILELMRSGAFAEKRVPEPEPEAAVKDKIDLRACAARIWRESQPLVGTIVEHYLRHHRGISIPLPNDVLRFHPACWHTESGTYAPAMVAVLQDVTGEKCAIQRTWLDETGNKADLKPARKSLAPTTGCAVRLHEVNAKGELAIGEGIETMLAATQISGVPGWSALSAVGVAGMVFPETVKALVIAVDRDQVGQRAADNLQMKLRRQGSKIAVVQVFPADGCKDFNDHLRITA